MQRFFYILTSVIVLMVGITFTLHNSQPVTLEYYFGFRWEAALSLLILISMIIGVIAGYLASLKSILSLQRNLSKARRDVQAAEQELAALRSLPIRDAL
ncbi:MAG: LapA family protein [Gammaproteobacteria bacterium]|nr:LapA family protein [Gammaproteobacteria bacterium]